MIWYVKILAIVILSGLVSLEVAPPAWATETGLSVREQGKALTFSREKGNCLSCHKIDDGVLYGDFGPPLVDLQTRFKDRAVLRAQIRDATIQNPETSMPPYGRHRILTDEEINKIVEYIWTLRNLTR